MREKRTSTRRRFLGQATAAAGGALSLPYVVPSSALGGGGAVAPSGRIAMGFIGTGGMGTNNMMRFMDEPDVQVVAVCDVERESNRYHGGQRALHLFPGAPADVSGKRDVILSPG